MLDIIINSRVWDPMVIYNFGSFENSFGQLGIQNNTEIASFLKKNQKVIEIKEVRLSLNIDTNDFNTKVNHAIKFLKAGNKVKVSVRFRGREMAHTQMGTVLMQRFTDAVAEVGTVEKQPKMEGRSMTMFITAKPVK